ncbi:uncharacterized protein LOC133288977 isoform X2 [Gastrolobium bilobum]|uniref:uncharacterized protein LOC133288977 isoform X2 n=1 Tax=Gastrolobium bilobum TaxID=150636 RepID=UPI002AB0AAFA|nr:uncharacterized protein LOC133288977 isoform X2 [Gastrolobium bilobum]
MALSADKDQNLNSDSINACCDHWKKKYTKVQESRKALRQAVKVLELKINEIQSHNNKGGGKTETDETLKECNARENDRCSIKSEITTPKIQQGCGSDALDGNENENKNKNVLGFHADREKEIGRLKELLETEKRRADYEGKKAAEAFKLLEAEKNKTAEKEMQIARIEAGKAEEYRIQIGRLEKQVNEAKMKLVSEMSTFEEATKRFEAEKRKILAEKRNAETGMAKAKERLEVEKNKATMEKRRADAEMVKLEKQKALAEDNWNKFMEEKHRADQMSQQLEEDKRTIEDLKQNMHELSSLRKPIEVAADISLKAESTKVKLLKNQLKLEKLRAKHARQKYKSEASRYSILHHQLGRLKIDFIQLLHRLDILDASFSPFDGSIHDQTKFEIIPYMQNSNVMRQSCNLNLSQMHSQIENEFLEPGCRTMDACDQLRKNMQCTPLLALSGGNYSETITGIDSKLNPLVRGSNRTKLQSSAVNSSTESFSDGQLMGSQEISAFPVTTASAKLTQEIFDAGQSLCYPSDRSVTVHHRKREKMHNTLEDIANLSSENLSDLHGLLSKKVDKCLEGGREMLHNLNNSQEKNKRAHKKRKKSHREKMDMIPQINRDEKKGRVEAKAEVYDDANVCRHTSFPPSYTLETTQACGERMCDAANNFDSMFSFDKVADGSYMKLLELENAADEKYYRRAMDFPLSPSLPEIEFHEIVDADNLMNPFLEEALQEDMLSSRTDLFPSPLFDVINVEINSNEQKIDVCGDSCNSQKKPTLTRKTEIVKLPHMHTPENSRTAFVVEDGIGSLRNQVPKLSIVFSNTEDKSIISRILIATKNCIARCNLATETGWAVSNILTALKMEEKLLKKEKVSVLLTLLLFNFTVTTTMIFGKLWDGNLLHCLNSYSEHICTVMSDAETRILFLENYSFHELLGLIGDFLIEGKVIANNILPAETLSDCDLRTNDFLDYVDKVSSGVASSEQLVAGSIILASLCAATDHVGFMREASYDILRLCKWDSLMVLTMLHIFAYMGGEKFFDMHNFGLMVTVLKSLVMFLEGGSQSVATACFPSINQLHNEFCTTTKCPFSEGSESIDVVACLLLEEIKNCWLQGVKRVDLSDSRLISDNDNAGHWSNQEAVQCVINKKYDAPFCLKKFLISAAQPDALKNVTFCYLSDILSLLELVASKMSWCWTDIKLVPRLLKMLDTCMEENFAIPIIVILGQLGRIGVNVGGYEDRGVEKLRCNLFAYLCRTSSMKAGLSLQIATATSLFGLLHIDPETLFHTNISLPAYSKSVSDNAETLRRWFSGLGTDQQKLLSAVLKRTDVCSK